MITLRVCRSVPPFSTAFVPLILWVFAWSVLAFGQATAVKSATTQDIKTFFRGKQKIVLTFVGYSGAGYEDEVSMRKEAERVLSEFGPAKTIVNIGSDTRWHRCRIRTSKAQRILYDGNRVVTGKTV